MIVVVHNQSKVLYVNDLDSGQRLSYSQKSMTHVVFEMASAHKDRIILWCADSLIENLNTDSIKDIFQQGNILASFNPSDGNYLPPQIGYCEESAFINVNKKVKYPTWQMSSAVGGIKASTLLLFENAAKKDHDFDYFLNSLAKVYMPDGMFCYSEPALLSAKPEGYFDEAAISTLFRFVSQHYKVSWIFMTLLNFIVHEKRFPIGQAVASLFYKRRQPVGVILSERVADHAQHLVNLDVIIPTIGRKPYLHDVLKDLSAQTLLPQKVIITEQNPLAESTSELDYINNESWPFKIRHIFTHQTGACNARNVALKEVESDWIFLADDDIRLEPKFLESAFAEMEKSTGDVFNICCLTPGKTKKYSSVHQTSIFGAGCSIISRKSLGDSNFNMAYEFGFGEDSDFGMQLINKGYDIKYLPEPAVIHLKAPVGGFRTKPKLAWDNDAVQPKPSPTVMLYKLTNHSAHQLRGYKTTLFLKFYRHQPVRNPFKYYRAFNEGWKRSGYWAEKLLAKSKNQI